MNEKDLKLDEDYKLESPEGKEKESKENGPPCICISVLEKMQQYQSESYLTRVQIGWRKKMEKKLN